MTLITCLLPTAINSKSMQFIRCVAVGVLITLYLSTNSCCHYIPDRKSPPNSNNRRTDSSSRSDRIRICGDRLTTLMIEACDGIFGSFNQVSSSRETVQTKITEDCCDQECSLDDLQNYCGETQLFALKKPRPRKTLPKKLLNIITRNPPEDAGATITKATARSSSSSSSSSGVSEVANSNSNSSSNRTWPSIQIGTVPPEIDKFGGQPIVVLKKNKSNSV